MTVTVMTAAPATAPDESAGSDLTGFSGWVVDVVEALGPLGVGLLVFLENLFPPVPSELILPLAGFLAGQGRLGLVMVILAATIGSLAGALVLYLLGAKLGEDRIRRAVRWLPLLDESDLDRAVGWFAKHGDKAVLIGRMVPVVRSIVSIPAGVERMPLGRFCLYTVLGSGLWNTLFVVLGAALGSQWSKVNEYSHLVNYVVLTALGAAVLIFLVRRVIRIGRHRRQDAPR